MTDVIVIGGGVIGLSIAWQLAGAGRKVRLLEQGQLGQEASWAGAGILPPGNPKQAETPEARLRGLSSTLWPAWSDELRELSGVDNGYRRCGGIQVRLGGASGASSLEQEIANWRGEGIDALPLSAAAAHALEPALNAELAGAYELPDVAQVRNPRHVKALIAACVARGVELLPGHPVYGLSVKQGVVEAAHTPAGLFRAEQFCVAGGAWSGGLLAPLGIQLAVAPVRGQIVLFNLPRPLFGRILESGPRYLVPRPDGRVLAGATVEHVGFDKRNTASGVRELIDFATSLVPSLAGATLERTWAGLRPGSVDGLPYLGRAPGVDNLFIAAGHYRAGLQMSPGTAVILRELILGHESPLSLEGFEVERQAQTAVEME